jgi:hypothetical protein
MIGARDKLALTTEPSARLKRHPSSDVSSTAQTSGFLLIESE